MDPVMHIMSLYNISSKIGKNNALLNDIKELVSCRDEDEIQLLIYAIDTRAHVSVIEFLATYIQYKYYDITIKIQKDILGFDMILKGGVKEYLNILYHTNRKLRAYYGAVAIILKCRIIKPHNARKEYIDSLINSDRCNVKK